MNNSPSSEDNGDLILLTDLPAELHRLTGETPPSYDRLKQAGYSARFPLERVGRSRAVRRRDLAAIAQLFGIGSVRSQAAA